MNIMRQHTDHHHGNCLITDNIIMGVVFGSYIVEIIRKYDNGTPLDFRARKEFTDVDDAIDYYNDLVDNIGKR